MEIEEQRVVLLSKAMTVQVSEIMMKAQESEDRRRRRRRRSAQHGLGCRSLAYPFEPFLAEMISPVLRGPGRSVSGIELPIQTSPVPNRT